MKNLAFMVAFICLFLGACTAWQEGGPAGNGKRNCLELGQRDDYTIESPEHSTCRRKCLGHELPLVGSCDWFRTCRNA